MQSVRAQTRPQLFLEFPPQTKGPPPAQKERERERDDDTKTISTHRDGEKPALRVARLCLERGKTVAVLLSSRDEARATVRQVSKVVNFTAPKNLCGFGMLSRVLAASFVPESARQREDIRVRFAGN